MRASKTTKLILLFAWIMVCAAGFAVVHAQDDTLIFTDGYTGRFKTANDMDDPLGYCLDVAGPPTNINISGSVTSAL